jgi:hypothetical protein
MKTKLNELKNTPTFIAEFTKFKKDFAEFKGQFNTLKTLFASLDKVVTEFKTTFANHTHQLNGYTSE